MSSRGRYGREATVETCIICGERCEIPVDVQAAVCEVCR